MKRGITSKKTIAVTTAGLFLFLLASAPGGAQTGEPVNSGENEAALLVDNDFQTDDIASPAAPVIDEPLPRQSTLIDLESFFKLRPESSSLPQRDKSNNESASARYKQGIPCVPLMMIDDPSTLIVCDRNAVFKTEKRTVTLSRGKGVYMVGKLPLTVETALGVVNLPGNSAAIIEQAENGLLRIDHLTGPASTVSVKRWKGTRVLSACTGEEICLAPANLPASSLQPRDGIERRELSAEIGDAGIRFSESKFAPKHMLDKECLLQCNASSFFQMRRKVYELRRSIDEQESGLLVGSQNADSDEMPVLLMSGSPDAGHLKAVTLAETDKGDLPLYSKETSGALVKYNSKTSIDFSHPSVSELKNGEALVYSRRLSYMKTPHSMLRMEPGSLARVSVSDAVTKVRNLWENHRRGIRQTVDGQPFFVTAGDESISGPDLRSVYLSASGDLVGRRLPHYTELSGGSVVHFAEVSLISLAQSSDLLAQLSSSVNPDDQMLSRKLNKMAAILVQISAAHGMYELIQPLQWRRELRSSALGQVY